MALDISITLDGAYAFIGGTTPTVDIYSFKEQKITKSVTDFTARIPWVATTADGKYVIASS
jgi:hypothetical protein